MVAHSSTSVGRVVPYCLRYLLLNVALLSGCAATKPGRPAATPAPPSVTAAAPTPSRPPPPKPPMEAAVSCTQSELTPGLLSRPDTIANLDGWPLDGSDPAPGSDKENPVMRCGPSDSYIYVASVYRCPDGTNPLGGRAPAGRRARRGNVGDNSHHNGIIDLYDVPCASGPQEVYVNMYGCPDAPSRALTGKGLALRDAMPQEVLVPMNEALDLHQEDHNLAAIAKVKQALTAAESKLGPQHPHRATLFDLLAALYAKSEQMEEAEQAWVAAYQLWQLAEWPSNPLVGNTCLGLAAVYVSRKQPETTACLARHAITVLEDVKGSAESFITLGRQTRTARAGRTRQSSAMSGNYQKRLIEGAIRLDAQRARLRALHGRRLYCG